MPGKWNEDVQRKVAGPKTALHHCCCLIIFLMRIPEPQIPASFRVRPCSSGAFWLFQLQKVFGGEFASLTQQWGTPKPFKPLKHTAMLTHYFWCNHIYNFLVAQQKERLWFHSPAVLTPQRGQEWDILAVCSVLGGMEHYQRGAGLFIPPALARQC